MSNGSIFHPDFKARPFWWEAHEPKAEALVDVPGEARVAIIGGGYAGLAAALQLAKEGVDAVVLEAAQPGFGASTRNGGMVSGGVTVGKRYSGKDDPARLAELYGAAADSFGLIERLIEDEGIDCEWTKSGRFGGAWCRAHYRGLEAKVEPLNRHAQADAYMLDRDRQREEIGSDYYHGGLVVGRAAHLHPAKYFAGLYRVARDRGAVVCAAAPVTKLDRQGAGWVVETERGTVRAGDVIVATNGYTGAVTPALRRRVIPVNSYIIATEELPIDLAASLMPHNKSVYDTRRLLTYYRMSGDRRRLIFGGRASFRGQRPGGDGAAASSLHDRPVSAARRQPHHPRLDRQCRLHLRRGAAYGNAGRAALRPRLQWLGRGDDDLSRDRDGTQGGGAHQPAERFRDRELSRPLGL